MRLRGSSVVVTGAARGIGAGIARVCADEGAAVTLVDVDEAVTSVAAEVDGLAIVADVTEPGAPERVVAAAEDRFGSVRGLVNNAALLVEASVVDTTDEQWDRVLAVGLTAPWRWARAVIPAMRRAGSGSIVNIASIEATRVRRDHAAYVSAKSGLLGLTRAIAIDHGREGIRCNAVSPGSIDTEMFRGYVASADDPVAFEAALVGMNYAGRLGTTEEIGALVAYLLSADSGFVNGADVVIDGGRIAAT